jgi:DnaJ-domain-containing protein 1
MGKGRKKRGRKEKRSLPLELVEMMDRLEETLRLFLETLERDIRQYQRVLERTVSVLEDPKLWASFSFPFFPSSSPSSSTSSSVSSSFSNPYQVLGVSPFASDEEIRSAYLRMAKSCHPDRGGNVEEMKRINKAYEEIKRMRGMI